MSQRRQRPWERFAIAGITATVGALAAGIGGGEPPPKAAEIMREWFEQIDAQPTACPPGIEALGDATEATCVQTTAKFSEIRRRLTKVEARHDRRLPISSDWPREGPWLRRWIVAPEARIAGFDEERGLLVVLKPHSCLERELIERLQPVAESTPHQPAEREHYQRPEFPEEARVRREGGAALVQFLITAEGDVAAACVLTVSPEGLGFETAAVEAARQWKYRPALRDSRPVALVADTWLTWEIRRPDDVR